MLLVLFLIFGLNYLVLVPKVQFRHAVHVGNENAGQISATVYRSGDVSYKSTVRCYSRQGTAQVVMDFSERPNTDASIITFLPGNAIKSNKSSCVVCVTILTSNRTCSKLCFNLSYLFVSSGESEKPCLLVLVDDTIHEEDEELRLVLGSPKSASPFGASIGKQNETLIKINDDADSKNDSLSCQAAPFKVIVRRILVKHYLFYVRSDYNI